LHFPINFKVSVVTTAHEKRIVAGEGEGGMHCHLRKISSMSAHRPQTCLTRSTAGQPVRQINCSQALGRVPDSD